MKLSFLLVGAICLVWVDRAAGRNSSDAVRELVQSKIQERSPELLAFYKDLHAHPELSFMEEQTSAHVADRLRRAGYEVSTGLGKYGVVGVLRNGSGPAVLLPGLVLHGGAGKYTAEAEAILRDAAPLAL